MITTVPVTWDGLDLNLSAEDDRGVLRVVEDVTGWYDSPPYDGRNATFVLVDGAQRGPKTAGPRDVVITGVGLGSRSALALFRDDLIMRAASVTSADLAITDGADRTMTARVRADSDAFKHAFTGPTMFRYQLTVTATDPRLYGPVRTATLTNAEGVSGWLYDQTPPPYMTVVPSGQSLAQVGSETLTVTAGALASAHFTIRPQAPLPGGASLQLFSPSANNWTFGPESGPLAAGQVTDLTAAWTVPDTGTDITTRLVMQGTPSARVDVTVAELLINGVVSNANPYFAAGTAPWEAQYGSILWVPPGSPPVRLYPRAYASPVIPNSAVLRNEGNVAAPVHALYTGDLSQSRLMSTLAGGLINLAQLTAGAQVMLDTSTLVATAPGGASRASYVLPGSQAMLVAPASSDQWSLYAAGAGSVLLTWRPAWQ